MKEIGSMEQGQAFGTYVPNTSVNPLTWFNHTEMGKTHRMFAEIFQHLAPEFYRNQQFKRCNYSIPALGVDSANSNADQDRPFTYCSNLAYTYSEPPIRTTPRKNRS